MSRVLLNAWLTCVNSSSSSSAGFSSAAKTREMWRTGKSTLRFLIYMDAIWQKIKADIASKLLISALIVGAISVAAALLTLSLATLLNLAAPYDKSFAELNAAHLWLYFDRDRIRTHDIQMLEALPEVRASTGLQYSLVSRVRIRDTRVWTSLRVTPPEMPIINRLLVLEGSYLLPGQSGVLASKDLDDLYHLAPGDRISLTAFDGKEFSFPIVGLAYNAMWDTYRNSQPPYLYLSPETLRKIEPDENKWDWSMGLRLTDPEAVNEVLATTEAALRPGAVAGHTDWRDVKRSAIFGAQLNFIFLGAFSLFAILATLLIVVSSVSSTVLTQFRQIGILKAIGFSQTQVLWLYVGQYGFLGALGVLPGLALGVLLAPLPLKSVAASLSAPFQPAFDLGLFIAVLLTILGVTVLATLGSAYRGARANIVKAIAAGAETPRRKPFWLVRLATYVGAPLVLILGLNDIFARPFRSLLTGLNLMLGVIGIVFGLTLNDTLKNYREDPSLLGIVYDATVTRQQLSDSQTRSLLRRAPGVAAFYGESLVEAKTLSGQSFQVRAVEGDLAAFPFHIAEGRFFLANTQEAIAGRGLLDWLGLNVGDSLTLVFGEKSNRVATWKIVGQYPEPVNSGQMLMVSWPSITSFIKQAKPDRYFLKLAPGTELAQLKRYLEPGPDADLNFIPVGQAIPDAVVYLQLSIFFLAGILIAVAVVNVFITSLLAMQEKLKITGILKTLGMTPAQVMAVANTSAGCLALLATAAGVPLGLAITKGMLTTLSNSYGFGEVKMTIDIVYALLLIPLVILASIGGSYFPGRWAARVPIVRVLRYE